MTQQISHETIGKAKVGAVAGLVAGFALFSSFLSIDVQLDIPNGTFYKTIGMPLGLEGFDAVAFGFFAHMGSAALIGAAYCVVASKWRAFQIVTVSKGVLTGAITGIIVFTVFFLPAHYFVMYPMVVAEFSVTDESRLTVAELEALHDLLLGNDQVLWYSLFLHVLFGTVMGFMAGMMLHGDYKHVRRVKGFW